MNPADECLAFRQLIDQGADVEGIARRFGLTQRFVEGRLRLADLSPVVFEALGAGEISLEVAKAYAATPDQERQAYVFEQMRHGYGGAYPDSIRRMMTQETASSTDRRARFVGEDAYVAAGGRIERDLFADDAGTRWLDVALLERLASEKLDALARDTVAETGLGWVRPTLERWVGYELTDGLERVAVDVPPLTEDETAKVDALEAVIEELASGLESEDMSEGARAEAEDKLRGLAETIEAITDKPPIIADDLKPTIGAFLILDEQGRARLDRTFYSETASDGATAPDDGGNSCSAEDGSKAVRAPRLSQRLISELSMQRRDVLAVHVAADPGFALDLAIFLMADRDAAYSFEKSGSSLVAAPPPDPVAGFKTPSAAATLAKARAADALDRSWTDGKSRAERFDAFRALSEDARAAWLGHAVAQTLEASLNLAGDRRCAFHDHLGTLLGINVAQWWRPTGATYFDRVPKSMTLAALAEVGGPELAGRYASAKKAELSQSAERIFAGEFLGDTEVKDAALAWVPEAMRFGSGPADCDQEESEAEGADADAGAAEPDSGSPEPEVSEQLEEAA
jgi:ParB family chromosome partitioning protein